MKLLKPKLDVVFKMIFADEGNIDILRDFLSAVLGMPKDQLKEIKIESPFLKREVFDDKEGIVDLRVTTADGKQIHIEMQLANTGNMPERMIYYNSKLLCSQLKTGQTYYDLKRTISILIADFNLFDDENKYHSVFQYLEKDDGTLLSDITEINVLELRKVKSLKTQKDLWLTFLNAENEEDFKMIAQKSPEIDHAVLKVIQLSEDEENQLYAEAREKQLRDIASMKHFAETEGRNIGIKEGKKEVARSLKAKGVSIDIIMDSTDLSKEEIEAI